MEVGILQFNTMANMSKTNDVKNTVLYFSVRTIRALPFYHFVLYRFYSGYSNFGDYAFRDCDIIYSWKTCL